MSQPRQRRPKAAISIILLSVYRIFTDTNLTSLDPAEWVPKQYAIINVDAGGINDSEGNVRCWDSAEGEDGHDTVEEVAKLPWCSGKVSMAGNSWLAACQWYTAAQNQPHLACIAPMEGISDTFREHMYRGGIPNTRFATPLSASFIGRFYSN